MVFITGPVSILSGLNIKSVLQRDANTMRGFGQKTRWSL